MFRSLRRRPDVERAAGPLLSDAEFFGSFDPARVFGRAANPLALPAFYRGLRHRTDILSSLPLHAEIDDKPAGVPIALLDQPDPAEDRMATLSKLEASLVLRGEFVCVLGGWDDDGYANVLKVVDPAEAELKDDGTWLIGGRTFGADEVLHRIAMALPGLTRGVSVVELFRRVLAGEIAAQDYQAAFYRDGGQPTTVLSIQDPDVTPEDLDKLLSRYMEKVRGGRREPIALPSTITVQPVALTNRDAQFLESRQFSMTDVANIVGVPAYFVGAPGSSSTYSNITDQRRDLLDIYLRSDLYAIERGFTSLLPAGLAAKFNPKSFLRLDPKAEADTLQVQAAWMTLDEIRAVQGLPPLPNGDGARIGASVLPGAPPAADPQESASAV